MVVGGLVGGGGGGREVSSGWMSYLPQVQTESFLLFFFFYLILLTCKRLTKIYDHFLGRFFIF